MTKFVRPSGFKPKVNKKKHVQDESLKKGTINVENKPAVCEPKEKHIKKGGKRGNKRKLEEEASTEVNDQEMSEPQNDAILESSKKGTKKVENKPTVCETEEKNVNKENPVTKKGKRGNKRKLEEEASTEVNDQEMSEPQNDAILKSSKKGTKKVENKPADCETEENNDNEEKLVKKVKLEDEASTEVNDQETNKPKSAVKYGIFKGGVKRRIPDDSEHFISIYGYKVKVMYYNQFLVKLKDGMRLIKLRKDLIRMKVHKSAMDTTMKLEIKRAQKALAHERKKVCFKCRKGGHSIYDCPEVKNGPNPKMTENKICLKCGSTEHITVKCTTSDSFQFATCFICKKAGHISKECPDNEKGIYPRGGSCNLCGDVKHYKIDCPQFKKKIEENTVSAQVSGDEVESSGDDVELSGDDVESSGDDVESSGNDLESSGDDVESSGDDVESSGDEN